MMVLWKWLVQNSIGISIISGIITIVSAVVSLCSAIWMRRYYEKVFSNYKVEKLTLALAKAESAKKSFASAEKSSTERGASRDPAKLCEDSMKFLDEAFDLMPTDYEDAISSLKKIKNQMRASIQMNKMPDVGADLDGLCLGIKTKKEELMKYNIIG